VADHRRGGAQADLGHLAPPVCAVLGLPQGEQPLDDVRDEEPRDEQQQRGRYAVHMLPGARQRLRQQVEADDAEHQAAGEPEHEVAAVGHEPGRPAADQRHQERSERHEHDHGPFVADRYALRTRGVALGPLVVGVGAGRGVHADEVVRLVTGVLDAAGLPLDEVAELATVEARAAEPGLLRAAALLGVPLAAYPASALARVRVPHPSPVARAAVGTPSVAEAAALLRGGRLVVPKTVSSSRPARATCAVARLPAPAPGPAAPPAGTRRSPSPTARQATGDTASSNSTRAGPDDGTAGPREAAAASPRQNGRGPAEGGGG
jgi:hypothetical protein